MTIPVPTPAHRLLSPRPRQAYPRVDLAAGEVVRVAPAGLEAATVDLDPVEAEAMVDLGPAVEVAEPAATVDLDPVAVVATVEAAVEAGSAVGRLVPVAQQQAGPVDVVTAMYLDARCAPSA